MAINTSEVTVLGSVCRRAPNGKYQIFLQVQTRPGAPLAYVKGPIAQPPLPGTRIQVTGSVSTTPHGPLVTIKNDSDLVYMSGQQGVLLRDLLTSLLTRFDIAFDPVQLEKHCFSAQFELLTLDKNQLIDLLNLSGIADSATIVNERESLFSSALTKGFFDGLERIKMPFLPDLRRDLPFSATMWPSDVMRGFSPDYMKVSHGIDAHNVLGKKIYITDFIKHEGIDNFYRSLAVYMNKPDIFENWIQENKRPSTIASAFIKDKQKDGLQIFDNDAFKQLERFGIAHAGKTLSRLGQMFQIDTGDTKDALVSQGSYQSSSRIATLDKLSTTVPKLHVEIDDSGLDPTQSDALHAFCEGVPLLLVSGPAGTGKSTLTARMINHAINAGEQVVVLTLPSKAAARLNISLENEDINPGTVHAQTIHSLFYNHGEHTSFKHIHLNTIKAALDSTAVHSFPVRVDKVLNTATFMNGKTKDLKLQNTILEEMLPPALLTGVTVFLDESSQITSDILALIFEMRPKRVVMVGDYGQLRPVGAGKPFHDLIKLYNDGFLHNKISYIELKTDHRATKELSSFTSHIRNGELPLDSVTSYDSDMDTPLTIVDHIYHKEGAVVECKKDIDSANMVDALFHKDIIAHSPFYTFSYRDSTARFDQDAVNINIPCEVTNELSVSRSVFPDIMLMSSTNVAVNSLCDRVKSILRPHMVVSQAIKNIPLFSNFIANDNLPGEIIMQTVNANRRINYTTPSGTYLSSKTMNGETYVFLGANIWLPLPTQSNLRDIEFAVNNAWEKAGLIDTAKKIDGKNPNSHYQLYEQLLKLAVNNDGAKTLLNMALGELILIPQHALRSFKPYTGQKVDCDESRVCRIPVLPEKPFSINNGIVNDSGSMGLIHDVWKINETYGRKKRYGSSNIEYPHYVSLVEESIRMQSTFVSGNAFTSHKAQGGQAHMAISVVIPPINDADSNNHEEGVYTSVTRAEKKSFVILQEKTAFDLNNIWSNTRKIEEHKFSLIRSIADGRLAPLCDTLKMTSVATPYSAKFKLPSLEDVNTLEFHKRVALSSIGIPAEINPAKMSHSMSELVKSISPNNRDIDGSSVFPDSGRLCKQSLTSDLFKLKSNFHWQGTQEAPIKNAEEESELNDLLSDVLSDLTFN